MILKAKHILLFMLMAAAVFPIMAGSKLSSATRLWLLQQRQVQRVHAQQERQVQVFVAGSDRVAQAVRQAGGKVSACFDGFVSATVPVSAFGRLEQSAQVSQIDISRRVHLLCDSDRSLARVNQVLSGTGLPRAYDGTGVVLGIVDAGFDFNHPAFLNADSTTRICRVYACTDDSGPVAVLGSDTLPGSLYDSTQVVSLTTDSPSTSHGSHVAGIAGGTLCGNYGGMAPGASLYLAALPGNALTEVNIVNSCYLIARYAESVGKPCVINMSLGNHDGPHDGTGFMARAFDDICTHIGHTAIVLSAGNEGRTYLYVHRSLADGKPLRTALASYNNKVSTEVDIWNQDTTNLAVTLGVLDRSKFKMLYSTSALSADTVVNCDADSALSLLASGKIALTWGRNVVTGKTEVMCNVNFTSSSSNYMLCFAVSGDRNSHVHMWECEGSAYFTSYGVPGYLDGNDSCSISDMATGARTISVGAYVGRNSHRNASGGIVQDTGAPVGTKCTFSSWGTDLRGVKHPIVMAPGQAVISSLNSYLPTRSPAQQQGKYCWGTMSGTSMSSPCVAGIAALWMQANPNLTGSQVRQLALETSHDGKVDALAGILQALSLGVSDVQASTLHLLYASGTITATKPCQLQVYSLTGQLHLSTFGKSAEVGNLSPGIYLVRASCASDAETIKIVKR